MFDWSDLRHLIAVSRYGSTLAAAKALGVNQSTVHRRLGELESGIGLTLVKRHPTGYRLSELGETLIDYVLAVETAVGALERQVQALKHDLRGVIRLTCPEPTVARIAATGLLDRFHQRYPASPSSSSPATAISTSPGARPTSPSAPASPPTTASSGARSAIRYGRSTPAGATSSSTAGPTASPAWQAIR